MIYHLTDRAAWEDARARGKYNAPSLDSEGFIHCSTREQVLDVANQHYRGEAGLLLLCIDENRLRAKLRWEAPAHPKAPIAESSHEQIAVSPSIWCLNLDAVVAVYDFRETETGFALPANLR